ncbi:hypothetical protein ACHAPT_012613 [Fusarium lateritium]
MASSLYAVRDIPGKGRGFIAINPIPKGTRILAEEPILMNRVAYLPSEAQEVKAELVNKFKNLSAPQKKAFLALSKARWDGNDDQAWGIFISNALEGPDPYVRGLYLTASRINHSCVNNAYQVWNEGLSKLTVHALKDIAEGEEITICYLAKHQGRAQRRQVLRGFTCTCSLCSLQGQRLAESDQRLQLSSQLFDLMMDETEQGVESAGRRLRVIRAFADLITKEGVFDNYSIIIYTMGFHTILFKNDLARAKTMLERCNALTSLYMGDDNPTVQANQVVFNQMTNYRIPATAIAHFMWRSDPDQVPEGLAPEAFEDWLWRDKKACLNGLADLRNETVFPCFGDLCLIPRNSPDYFTLSNDGSIYQPCKAWCVLAQIIGVKIDVGGAELLVRDNHQTIYPISFTAGGQNSKALDPEPQIGWTVALMYPIKEVVIMSDAVRHLVRVRAREKDFVKIFPTSLGNLMMLNARVQKFSIQHDGGVKTCHGCQRQGTSLKACSACKIFWYCDQDCQARGWRHGGHRNDCKLLRDSDLEAIFRTAWDDMGMGEGMLTFLL